MHTYDAVKSDILMWLPKIKKGCFIGGHDYSKIEHPSVTQAVDEAFGKPDKVFIDTSWVKRIE